MQRQQANQAVGGAALKQAAAPFKLYRERANGWRDYYTGGHPPAWSASEANARLYWNREQAVNAREHVSAHTYGVSIRIQSAA